MAVQTRDYQCRWLTSTAVLLALVTPKKISGDVPSVGSTSRRCSSVNRTEAVVV